MIHISVLQSSHSILVTVNHHSYAQSSKPLNSQSATVSQTVLWLIWFFHVGTLAPQLNLDAEYVPGLSVDLIDSQSNMDDIKRLKMLRDEGVEGMCTKVVEWKLRVFEHGHQKFESLTTITGRTRLYKNMVRIIVLSCPFLPWATSISHTVPTFWYPALFRHLHIDGYLNRRTDP